MYFRQLSKRKSIEYYKREAKEDNCKKLFCWCLMSMSYCSQEQCVGPIARPVEQAQLALLPV